MVKVVGKQQIKARIRGITGEETVREVGKALFVIADRIKVRAQHSITEGSISGKGHIASAPGQPPNADTHSLDRQIESELVSPLKAIASSNARHSIPLELGTSKMAARPFMAPAGNAERKDGIALVRQAVTRANSRGAR